MVALRDPDQPGVYETSTQSRSTPERRESQELRKSASVLAGLIELHDAPLLTNESAWESWQRFAAGTVVPGDDRDELDDRFDTSDVDFDEITDVDVLPGEGEGG